MTGVLITGCMPEGRCGSRHLQQESAEQSKQFLDLQEFKFLWLNNRFFPSLMLLSSCPTILRTSEILHCLIFISTYTADSLKSMLFCCKITKIFPLLKLLFISSGRESSVFFHTTSSQSCLIPNPQKCRKQNHPSPHSCIPPIPSRWLLLC